MTTIQDDTVNRSIPWTAYINLNVYWLGLTSLSQTMTPLVVPLLVEHFVGEQLKGTYYGTLRLWTLMVALLVQSLMGMLSDRSTLPWGRRRPFILVGTLGVIGVLILIGLSAGLDGMTGYWILFTLMLLQMVASNIAHSAQQGLIPDLVPVEQRGRFSGVKAIFEVPLPVILVSFTIGRLVAAGNLWGGLLALMLILLVTMAITMTVPEKQAPPPPAPLDWKPFIRLALMTAVFAAIILGLGQAVILFIHLFQNISLHLGLVAMLGLAGLAAMLAAIVAGVWASMRIGLGNRLAENHTFTWWVINRLAFLVGSTNLGSFALYFLQARLGFVAEKAAGPTATLLMFVGVFILISAFPGGWLADRFGRKPLVAWSGLMAAAGTVWVVLSPNLPLLYAGGVIIGVATGIFYTANWALGTDIVPQDQAGRFFGIANLAGAGSGAIGAYIGGPIADQITHLVPSIPGAGYLVIFMIYAVLFLFSIVALRQVKEPV